MTKIAVLVGSLSKNSINKKLANALESVAPEGVEFTTVDVDLPLYNYDFDGAYPEGPALLKQQIEEADGVLFVTPEYNRSFSGVMKNAIDWGSRPWGKSSFNGKPAAIAGASIGDHGTSQAQQALRNVLLFLNMQVMGQPEAYLNINKVLNEHGTIAQGSVDFLTEYIAAVAAHVEKNKA